MFAAPYEKSATCSSHEFSNAKHLHREQVDVDKPASSPSHGMNRARLQPAPEN